MKRYFAFVLTAFLPFPALANCVPPWQTQFACNLPEQAARAEFCRLSDPIPGVKEAYYSYAVEAEPAELYFQTDSTYFSTKDTEIDHPTDLTMAIGYARENYVYAFVVTEDEREADGIRDAEVRVYSSIDAFTNDTKDTEITKLYCDPASILADLDSIRP
ncbi:MAG TPA: hypothetical protein VGM83_09870 [Devosiaceae bacterium]|jgi:hypothetical protein